MKTFSGKEFDDELGLNKYGFGARFYDPAIARWGCIDPMADAAPNWTPFRYAFNNPVIITDPTGMFEDPNASGVVDADNVAYMSNKEELDALDMVEDQGGRRKPGPVRGNYHPGNGGGSGGGGNQPGYYELDGDQAGEFLDHFAGGHYDINQIGDDNSKDPKTISAQTYTGTPNKIKDGTIIDGKMYVDGKAYTMQAGIAPLPGIGKFNLKDLRDLYKSFKSLISLFKVVKTSVALLKPLGLGSTGRTVAKNLVEQMAMKAIMANPTTGQIIKNMKPLSDPRWLGWVKMEYKVKTAGGVDAVIHYVGKFENGILKAVDDFKFK